MTTPPHQTFLQPAYSDRVQALLKRRPAHFIDGAWTDCSSGRLIPVEDPSTGKVISHIADAGREAVDRAVAAARNAFDDGRWSGLAPIARETLMTRLAELMERDAALLAELESIDNGKPLCFSSTIDIPGAIALFRYMAGWVSKLAGESGDLMCAPPGAFHTYVRREPVGVAAQIIPWNFPLVMAALKVAPALAAGCTMVLKPAEQTPLTALHLADLIAEAGCPAGVFNLLTGRGETSGAYLVNHPGVDKVAFTGSTEVGKLINRAATESLKRVTLELGGKSPVVVMPDVDVKAAAGGVAQAIFFNGGQICVAGSRLFAHSSVFDALLEAIAEQAGAWSPGPSLCPGGLMGPLVSEVQRQRVQRYIAAGKAEGASVVVGGDAPMADGFYLNPTVLAQVKPSMKVVREEIFGPVLVAQRFDDLDEAVRAANDTVYGLGASIWTNNLSTMHTMAARIRAGTVWGNCHALIDPAAPFGGFKQSGFGREQARQGFEAYTELKSVIIAL